MMPLKYPHRFDDVRTFVEHRAVGETPFGMRSKKGRQVYAKRLP
jgi:hypothetical protein